MFEIKQRISEPALTTCDRCGGPVHRLLSAAPFILKGGGWYVSDYPSEARKKAMKSESPASSGGASGEKSSTGDAGASPSSNGSTSSDKGSSDKAKGGSDKGGGAEKSVSKDSAKDSKSAAKDSKSSGKDSTKS